MEEQLALAARRGDRSAVLFGSAHELPGQHPGQPAGPARWPGRQAGPPPTLRARLAATARAAGMAVCGAGCMGFVNVTYGLRAVGYVEPDPLPRGPVALITHSGSVFSALLRTRRGLGFTVAVSSGQELVTTAAQYAEYALSLPETRVLALVLEAVREPDRLRAVLATARARRIPVVHAHRGPLGRRPGPGVGPLRRAGRGGRRLGGAGRRVRRAPGRRPGRDGRHAGAVRPQWQQCPRPSPAPPVRPGSPRPATGGHRPHPQQSRPPLQPHVRTGIATVHDSGLERAHVADVADELGVPFAAISAATTARLAALLDPGLEPANPLDVWGTGARAQEQLTGSLAALADDPAVRAVALAVDLVHEFDGDDSYPARGGRDRPPDQQAGRGAQQRARRHRPGHRRRAAGRRHPGPGGHPERPAGPEASPRPRRPRPQAADHGSRPRARASPGRRPGSNRARQERWTRLITAGEAHGARLEELLRDYGIAAARTRAADSDAGALAAAAEIGYPVVLKTDEPGIAHKSDAGGVVLGVRDPDALQAAYQDLAERLGRRVLVCETIPAGPELSLGLARDHELGPLLVVGAGGVLVELLADRAVALPPVSAGQAHRMLGTLRVARLLAGVRGQPAADLDAVAAAITGLSQLAAELGDVLEALDINPLICGPDRAVAVDALAVPRQPAP